MTGHKSVCVQLLIFVLKPLVHPGCISEHYWENGREKAVSVITESYLFAICINTVS
jgi:hypothetical protein